MQRRKFVPKNRNRRSDEITNMPKYRPLNSDDAQVLESLSKSFHQLGVIRDGEEELESDTPFKDIFDKARRDGKSERELNPGFYSAEAERLARMREEEMEDDFFDNPSLDGIDDYGRQMYENNSFDLPSVSPTFGDFDPSEDYAYSYTETPADSTSFQNVKLPKSSVEELAKYVPRRLKEEPDENSEEAKLARYERALRQAGTPNGFEI